MSACSKPSPSKPPGEFSEVRVARKDGREPLYMNHEEAKAFCEERGMRLPTTREFAAHARERGAVGLAEKTNRDDTRFDIESAATYKRMRAIGLNDEESSRMKREGFTYVLKHDGDERLMIDFYYKSSGYQMPVGLYRTSNYVVWTSAEPMAEAGGGPRELCYGFFMKAGYFFKTACNARAMVVCKNK